MQTGLFDLVRKVGVFTVCTTDLPESKEECVNKMVELGMISSNYDASSLNCQLILDDMMTYMNKFTDDEIVGYVLKYFFGMENDKIHKQTIWLFNIPIACLKVDIMGSAEIY